VRLRKPLQRSIILCVSWADPRRAVVEHLTAPGAAESHGASAASSLAAPGRPLSRVLSGKPFSAERATIQFIKERGDSDRRLAAVTFDDTHARRWFYLVAAERDEHGAWAAHGIAGGCGGVPQRSTPWLNFCGAWGTGRLYCGGQVHAADTELSRIRLTLASGTQLEDDTAGDVALFVSDDDAAPVGVELYDAAGHVTASQPA
jgi:hypothetical protein